MSISAQNVNARRIFFFERPKLGLGLSYEFVEEERIGPDSKTKDSFQDLREKLEIETRGWVYHPALLEYTLIFAPQWIQTEQEIATEQNDITNKESGSKNLFLAGYFAEATIFQFKPYTFHLFGQRDTSPSQSALARRSETATDRYGADLSLKYKIQTHIAYTHYNSDQIGFYTSKEKSDDVRLDMRHQIDKSDTRLNAIYNDKTRATNDITIQTKSINSDIQNYYNITGDRRLTLNSLLSYRLTESGTTKSDHFENSGLRLSETLDWKHWENLRSRYRLDHDRNESGDFENNNTSLGAELTHLLYENLTSTIGTDATLNEFTEGSEEIYGGYLDFDYRRQIPWGMLNLSAGFDYETTRRDLIQAFIQVLNERHVLKTGDLTLLDKENVVIDSIRVTNSTGNTIYIKGIDYRLTQLGNFVRISRTPFGDIDDGEEVLVSYKYLSNPPFDDAIFGQSYGASLNLWSTLTLSYRYHLQQQEILSGTPPENLADEERSRAEIRLNWRWTDTRLIYEDVTRDSGISTTTRWAEEALTFRPLRQLFFRLSGRIGEREFKETGNIENFTRWRVGIDWLPVRWCKFSLEGYQDRVTGETEKTADTGLSAELELSYRIWGFRTVYDYVDEKDDIAEYQRKRQSLFIELTRTLW